MFKQKVLVYNKNPCAEKEVQIEVKPTKDDVKSKNENTEKKPESKKAVTPTNGWGDKSVKQKDIKSPKVVKVFKNAPPPKKPATSPAQKKTKLDNNTKNVYKSPKTSTKSPPTPKNINTWERLPAPKPTFTANNQVIPKPHFTPNNQVKIPPLGPPSMPPMQPMPPITNTRDAWEPPRHMQPAGPPENINHSMFRPMEQDKKYKDTFFINPEQYTKTEWDQKSPIPMAQKLPKPTWSL